MYFVIVFDVSYNSLKRPSPLCYYSLGLFIDHRRQFGGIYFPILNSEKIKETIRKNTEWLSRKDSLYLPLMIAVQSPDLQKWMFFIGDVWENFERSAFGDQHHWDWDLHYITLIFSFKGISQHKSCIVLEGLKMYFLLKKGAEKGQRICKIIKIIKLEQVTLKADLLSSTI